MKNKNNVYVEVESKEQAKMFRTILEAIGEPISFDYYPYDQRTKKLTFSDGWYLSREEWKSRSCITFGELIDLLQRKPLLISEDGIELFEDSDLFIIWFENDKWVYDTHHRGFKSIDGHWYVNPESKNEDRKLFSTKQSALEWIESHRPKEIMVSLYDFSTVKCTVVKDMVRFTRGDNNVPYGITNLNPSDIEEIYAAIKKIQNG